MKPNLVNYDVFFKKKQLKEIKVIPRKEINSKKIILNILSLSLLIIGFYLLFNRKKEKENKKKEYNQKVIHFFHNINLK
tara:strand:+ start:6874 stop:7110 length:237 start_codon:yes stop_codon:yes gene_type:complete